MENTQPLPSITERTFAVVQDLMGQEGLDGNDPNLVAIYVEKLVARERFFRTVDNIRSRTAQIDPDELQRMIDASVDEVEDKYRKQTSGAAPSR